MDDFQNSAMALHVPTMTIKELAVGSLTYAEQQETTHRAACCGDRRE